MPASDFPLPVPVADSVGVFEVLVEDPGATATGGGLAEQPSVSIEGRSCRRFLAQDVPPSALVTIDLGAPTGQGGSRFLVAPVIAAGAIMILALAFALTRRRSIVSAGMPSPRAPVADAEALARDIADLDDAKIIFKQGGNWLPSAEYQKKGYFEVKTGESDGHAWHQMRFTPAGIAWIAKRYARKAA